LLSSSSSAALTSNSVNNIFIQPKHKQDNDIVELGGLNKRRSSKQAYLSTRRLSFSASSSIFSRDASELFTKVRLQEKSQQNPFARKTKLRKQVPG
jgi:hypothetical protein